MTVDERLSPSVLDYRDTADTVVLVRRLAIEDVECSDDVTVANALVFYVQPVVGLVKTWSHHLCGRLRHESNETRYRVRARSARVIR